MLAINLDNIDLKCLYFCYSPNLYKFLRFTKNIEPIHYGVHWSKGTKFTVFIKCEKLQICLTEWKENKENGVFAITKKVGDVI